MLALPAVSERQAPLVSVARTRFVTVLTLTLTGAAVLVGCADPKQPNYYDPPRASTVTDAEIMSTGADYRHVVRAPSQLQIDLKPPVPLQHSSNPQQARAMQEGRTMENDQPVPSPTATSADTAANTKLGPTSTSQPSTAERNLVSQPQTYMGTLPCFVASMQCDAQRITLTLAPNGRWRGRSAYLDNTPNRGKPIAEQGCWQVTDEKPPHVFLIGPDGTLRAEFVVAANNVLRLRAIAGATPNLTYTLTRQPDMDPINELAKQAPPLCH